MWDRKKGIELVETVGAAEVYLLSNGTGMQARITNYGGIVMSLLVPDHHGVMTDVVLGYDSVAEYMQRNPYFGCLVGRYGNRIAKARFALGGEVFTLAANDGPNSLHGGLKGFDKVLWAATPILSARGPGLELRYLSKHLEEGFPGNLNVVALYTLTDEGSLCLDFTATTDRLTIINLTHHSYFNLAGQGDILGHHLLINADSLTPVDSTMIPTGELLAVDNTPFDFRTPTPIGARINDSHPQIQFGPGYDHNWVIAKPLGELGLVARVFEPSSRRAMEVFSTEPGVQFYTGNFLDGTLVGKGGRSYQRRSGFCLEPQHYPDSPNKPNFPSVVLSPGETYQNTMVYRFFVV